MAQLLNPVFTEKFKKQFKRLPQTLRERFNIKLLILLTNPHHPGFYSRKMSGVNHFEGRLTKHYRFTYAVVNDEIQFLSVGPHDEGLGKKLFWTLDQVYHNCDEGLDNLVYNFEYGSGNRIRC